MLCEWQFLTQDILINILKLALGTVQFGTKYGISNQSGVPDDEELVKYLDVLTNRG